MNNEEKILSVLENLVTTVTQMQGDITDLKQGQAEMRQDIKSLQQGQIKLEEEIKNTKQELKEEIHKTSGFLIDEIERRVDFKSWFLKQKI